MQESLIRLLLLHSFTTILLHLHNVSIQMLCGEFQVQLENSNDANVEGKRDIFRNCSGRGEGPRANVLRGISGTAGNSNDANVELGT